MADSATAAQPSHSSSAAPVPDGSLKGVVAAPTAISSVDGIEGKLYYRGYSIEDLAATQSFEEVVYLLWEGELPTRAQLAEFTARLAKSRDLPPQLIGHLRLIPPNAPPLAVLRTGVSLLAHYDPDSESMDRTRTRAKAERLLGQIGSLVGAWACIRAEHQPVSPRADLNAASNFLWMLTGKDPDSIAAHAMDVALVLQAEHEFNASSFAARVAAGTYVDLHSAMVAAIAALKGPRHGGANEDVIELVREIGDPSNAAPFIQDRLDRYAAASHEERANPKLRFPGFGHAVYKTWDPRARQLKRLATEVAEARGVSGIAEIQETIRTMVTARLNLNPNVDYYSAGLYHALDISTDLYTSIFAFARTAGYVAHIEEQLWSGRLIRPRGEYVGPPPRTARPLAEREGRPATTPPT